MHNKCSFCGSTHRVSRFKGGEMYCLKHYLQMRNHGEVTNSPPVRKWKNTIKIGDASSILVTAKGDEILVDNCMIPVLVKHSWCISKTGYAVANIDKKVIKMHRLITSCPKGQVVDHINGDPLDNRIENLRICSAKDNSRNKGLGRNNSTGVTGVSQLSDGKWRARIMVDRKELLLGRFESFEEAVKARKQAELKYFGEFANSLSRGGSD